MKIFKTHWFNKWAKKESLPDNALIVAVMEIERGLVDADLGGHVVKKRIAMPGRGKRGSMRTIVAYQVKDISFFIYGFAKNKRDNISRKELQALQVLADDLLAYDDKMLKMAVKTNE
ncbi:MAG: type II toxin-antitoxin system RelE/ParE family toxin, partial [Psychrosphaera sp.]|nr:type II toxin-antitoxin system RelE/ParE family toxin [Psychrosphaera sp.]